MRIQDRIKSHDEEMYIMSPCPATPSQIPSPSEIWQDLPGAQDLGTSPNWHQDSKLSKKVRANATVEGNFCHQKDNHGCPLF